VLAIILALAAQHPVLFIVEDLHWIDPSTLEFLALLIDQGPTAHLFTLLTCRPEFRAPWSTRTHLTPITLNRLPRRQVELIVERVAGGKALPAMVVQQVVAKTDGVPLFVEELTKLLLESGLLREEDEHYELTGALPPLAIPDTLHDSLMARLDRLTDAKAVAQLGATLGRTFAYDLLRAVSPLDEGPLDQALAQLVEAELLYQQGVPPRATYLFKHALIQEVAYQSLLKATRQRYHQQVARVLAERFPETVETQPELVAHHYTEAGLHAHAIPYWQQAGQQALQRSANPEAVQHLTTGLALLAMLPETPARAQQELDLQLALGAGVECYHGPGGPGGGADLRPRAGLMPAGRRHAPALPGAARLMSVLSEPGGVADGARTRRTALSAGAARGRADLTPGGLSGARRHLILSGAVRRRPDPSRAGDRPHRPSGAAGSGALLWRGTWGTVPGHGGPHTVVPGVSRTGLAAESGGACPSPGAGPSS
jgi:hypothetical protein